MAGSRSVPAGRRPDRRRTSLAPRPIPRRARCRTQSGVGGDGRPSRGRARRVADRRVRLLESADRPLGRVRRRSTRTTGRSVVPSMRIRAARAFPHPTGFEFARRAVKRAKTGGPGRILGLCRTRGLSKYGRPRSAPRVRLASFFTEFGVSTSFSWEPDGTDRDDCSYSWCRDKRNGRSRPSIDSAGSAGTSDRFGRTARQRYGESAIQGADSDFGLNPRRRWTDMLGATQGQMPGHGLPPNDTERGAAKRSRLESSFSVRGGGSRW